MRRADLERLPDEGLFARREDTDARRVIVERYDGLATRLALRFRGRGEDDDDLAQVARQALLKAIDRFDVELGFQFSTFATRTVLGELKRHLRDRAWSVRVPRSLHDLWLHVSRAIEELTHEQHRSPTIAEIARRLDVTDEEVLEAIDAGNAYTTASLDIPVGDDRDGATLGDLVGENDTVMAGAADRAFLAEHLAALSERERTILHLRFLEGRTQSEIADEVGVSQVHVSRILRRTLAELRRRLGGGGDPDGPR